MSNSLRPKSHKELQALMLVPYDHKMIALAMWIMTRLSEVIITSAYRKGDKGVAGTIPCRHLDIRSRIYDDPEKVVEDINRHWTYDHKRTHLKCALYHAKCAECGENNLHTHRKMCEKCGADIAAFWHIHLQTHDNTMYLGTEHGTET